MEEFDWPKVGEFEVAIGDEGRIERVALAFEGSFRLIADAGLVFTNVCFHTEAAIRNKICNAIAYLHDNLTDVPSVSGLAD